MSAQAHPPLLPCPEARPFSKNAPIVQNTFLHRPGVAIDPRMRVQPRIRVGSNHVAAILIAPVVVAGIVVHETVAPWIQTIFMILKWCEQHSSRNCVLIIG